MLRQTCAWLTLPCAGYHGTRCFPLEWRIHHYTAIQLYSYKSQLKWNRALGLIHSIVACNADQNCFLKAHWIHLLVLGGFGRRILEIICHEDHG